MSKTSTILVATDGSAGATAAVRWAGDLASAVSARLVVVHCPPESAESDSTGDGQARTAIEQTVSAWSRPAQHHNIQVDTILANGDPREQIPRTVAEVDPELVVVGARGAGGFERLKLGKVTEHLIHDTDRPLAVVPRAGGEISGGVVVTGVDGSDANRPAVEWALEMAGQISGRVEAVFVHDPMADSFPHPDWKYRGQQKAEDLVRSIPAPETTRVEFLNRGGNAVEELAELGDDLDAAMIVVGTMGHRGLGGRRIGHVAKQLPAQSTVPVVVIPHTR